MSSQPAQPMQSDIDDLGMSTAAPSVSDIETEILTPTVEYHSKFYSSDGMLKFLVGDQLFHIHAAFLTRESDMLKQVKDFPRDKVHDAVVLRGVTAFEFECLMDFFYNGMFDDYKSSWETAVALLKISSHFTMTRVYNYAVQTATIIKDKQDTITIIGIAKKYDIQDWLAPAYAELCQRSRTLSAEEGKQLGWETFALLAEAREKFIRNDAQDAEECAAPEAAPQEYATADCACSEYSVPQPTFGGWGIVSESHWQKARPKNKEKSQVPTQVEDNSQKRALSIVQDIFWPLRS